MFEKINNVLTEAVETATGKGWNGWMKLLDRLGARHMSHTEIAQMLYEKKSIHRSSDAPKGQSKESSVRPLTPVLRLVYAKHTLLPQRKPGAL